MLRNRRNNIQRRRALRRARLRSRAWEDFSDSEDVSNLDDLSEDDFDASSLDDDSSESSTVSYEPRAPNLTGRKIRRIFGLNQLNEPGPSNASSSSGNSRSVASSRAGKRKHKVKVVNSETSSDDMFATNERAPKRKRPRRTELVSDEDSESSTNLPVSTQRHCVIQSSSDDSIDSLDIPGQRMRRRHAHMNFLNDSETSINEDSTESGRSASPVIAVNRRPIHNGNRYFDTFYMTLDPTDTSSSSGSAQNSTSSSSSSTSSSTSSCSSSSSSTSSSSSSMSSDSVLSFESAHPISAREQQQQIISSDSDSSDSEGDKCAICLRKLRNQRIGNPSNCDHNFCLTCLVEWSKTSTTCPVDRSPFDAIIVREEPNGNMIERIEVQARVFGGFSGEEEVFNETIMCEICGSGDDESYLLLCDLCNSGYHMGCLRPPLLQIPEGSWFCPMCRTSTRDGVNRNSGGLTERLMAFMEDYSISIRRPARNRMRNTRTRLIGPPPRGRGPTLTRSRNHTSTNFSTDIVSPLLEERLAEMNAAVAVPQLAAPIVQKAKKRRLRARRQFSRSQPINLSQEIASKIRPSRRNDTVIRAASNRNADTVVETVFPSFNLFEDDTTAVAFSDDDDGEDVLAGELLTMSRVRSEFSARRIENRKSIVTSLVSAAYRQRTRPVTPPAVIDETESSSVNLLDSILESQTLWHSKNVEISSTKDGKLNVKLKQDNANKPDLQNTKHQSKQIPLFPGGSKNESNSSSPSDGNKSYTNNTQYSELSGGGGGAAGGGGSRGGSNAFAFSGASLNSLNPSTRPGFSNILGNNSSAVDLSPFRGAAPIRFRMNPPRPALRRPNFNAGVSRHSAASTPAVPLNLSTSTTTATTTTTTTTMTNATQSPRKSNTVTVAGEGGENDDEVDLYDDIESETVVADVDKPEMFASLKPPPEPPAMLMGESSSDDDNDGWVIDDANRSNIYDPTEPNEDSDVENDCVDKSDANIAPGYLRSPSYGGISEFGPHLPLPKPPALPIELDSANNSEEEDEAECPNMTLYSSTSISLANNVQDIPVPESRPDDLDCIPIPPGQDVEATKKTNNLYSPTTAKTADELGSDSDVQSVHSESTRPRRRSSSDDTASSSDERSASNESDDERRRRGGIRRKKLKKKKKKTKGEVIEPIEYYGESSDESERIGPQLRVATVNNFEESLQAVVVAEKAESTVDLTECEERLKEIRDEIKASKRESEDESEATRTTTELKEDEEEDEEAEEEEEEEARIMEEEKTAGDEKRNEDDDNAARIAKIVDEVRNSMEENAAAAVALAERGESADETADQTEPNTSTACLLPSDDLDPVSDVEYNDFVDYRSRQPKDRKKKRKKTKRRADMSPGGRARELEEGEIDDEQRKRQRSPLRKARRGAKSRSPSVSMVAGGEKKAKRKRDRKEKGDKENKDQDFQWKKLSKNTKERNYRAGKSKADGKGRDRSRKEKRKEIERYNVRKMLSDKPRRDKFGRDLSMGRSPRTKSRSRTPQSRSRSRSPSTGGAKGYGDHHRRGSKTDAFRKSFSQEDRWIDWSPVWSQRRSRSRTRRTRSRSRSRQRVRLSGDRYRNRSKNRDHGGAGGGGGRKRRRSVSSTLDRFSPVGGGGVPLTTKKRRHSRVDAAAARKSAASYATPSGVSEYFYERSWSRTMSYASLSPEPDAYPYERSPSMDAARLAPPVSVERDIIAPNPQNLTVIVPNVDAGKKKHKKKKDSKKKKKKQPSKEVFTSGDNIVVSVNFDDNQKTISAKSSKRKRTATVVGAGGQVEEVTTVAAATVGTRKKKKDDSSRKKRKQTLQVSEEVLNAKPVAVIDLNSSPCKEMSPTEVISLTDSGDEDDATATAASSKENASRSRPAAQQSGGAAGVELHRSYVMTSAGPKTPPEPPIKFTVTSGPMRSLPTNPIFEQDEELDNGEDVSVAHYNKGPNTPPESLTSSSGIQGRRTITPNATMYDPFEPTKSRSASPETGGGGGRTANESGKADHVDMFADDDGGGKSNDNQNASATAGSGGGGEHESGDAASNGDKIVDLDRDDGASSSPKANNADESAPTKISPNKEAAATETVSSSNAADAVQQANVVLDLTSLGDEFVPKSSIPLVKTSQGKYEFQGGKIPDKPITVVIAQQSTPIKPQPQQVMVTPTRQIPAKTIEPIKQPMFPDILPWKLPPQTSAYATPPSTVQPQSKSTPAGGGGGGGATQNGAKDCDANFELDDSPYSPASSEGDDLFEPPPLNASGASSLTARGLPLPPVNSYKSRVDALFGSSPAKKLQTRSTTHPSRTIGSHKSMPKKITKTIAHNKKDVGSKADEEQLRILDDVPNSAVEMIVKEKFLKKLHRQERVNEEVKVALKPHYAKKHITKEEYKDIMRKAVPKICHNKSGDINPSKIQSLVEAYVKKVRHSKKKGSTLPGSTGPPLFPSMAAAKSVKKQKSLWG